MRNKLFEKFTFWVLTCSRIDRSGDKQKPFTTQGSEFKSHPRRTFFEVQFIDSEVVLSFINVVELSMKIEISFSKNLDNNVSIVNKRLIKNEINEIRK